MPEKKSIAVLGSTGSIGRQTLDVIAQFPDAFEVSALTAASSVELLAEQAQQFLPQQVVIADPNKIDLLRRLLRDLPIAVYSGQETLERVAADEASSIVVTAMVGAVGLAPTIAAVEAGKRIALANKETLVVAGSLICPAVEAHHAEIIPVDSEHSAIFQCLVGEPESAMERLTLTASGGPFRDRDLGSFSSITRDEALSHPTWNMGPKITIDSATMMNKGLEVIEAHWLFEMESEMIDVLIHPQSIIHSMVTFVDGSAKAQLGVPDMRVPIQYALSYPDRLAAKHPRIDWTEMPHLDFTEPDLNRYPCLALAYNALDAGGAAPAILNAANEKAVELFLADSIRFDDIARLIEETCVSHSSHSAESVEALMEADAWARVRVKELANVRVH